MTSVFWGLRVQPHVIPVKVRKKSQYTVTDTVIFSSLDPKITLIVTVHYDGYCDFLKHEVEIPTRQP